MSQPTHVSATIKRIETRLEEHQQWLLEQGRMPAEPKFNCRVCEDLEEVPVDPERTGPGARMKWCDCKIRRLATKRASIVSRPVSRNWRGWSFERITPEIPKPVLGKLKRYVNYYLTHIAEHGEPPPKGLWIAGRSGAWKTAAAAVVVQEIGWRLHEVDERRWEQEWKHSWLAWRSLTKLLRDLRATQGELKEVSERELHAALASVDLLVLDDLLAPRITEFAAESLYGIFDARYDDGKPTIVTTNVVDEDKLEHVIGAEDDERGESIVRRVRERCVRVELPARDPEHAEMPEEEPTDWLAPKEPDPFDVDDFASGYGAAKLS